MIINKIGDFLSKLIKNVITINKKINIYKLNNNLQFANDS